MFDDVTLCVGTVGGGVHVSQKGGGGWVQVFKPVPPEGNVRALRVCPHDPARIWAGTDQGIFRSDDRGERWKFVASPLAGRQAWSVAVAEECLAGVPRTTNVVIDPRRPTTVWAGVEIDGVFRSDDGGDSWARTADLGPSTLSGDIHGLAVKSMNGGGPDDAVR